MGAKTWMLVYASENVPGTLAAQPAIDRDASTALAKKLFPQYELTPLTDGALDGPSLGGRYGSARVAQQSDRVRSR